MRDRRRVPRHDEERLAGVAAAPVDAVQEQPLTSESMSTLAWCTNSRPLLSNRSAAVRLGKAAVTAMGLEPSLLAAGGGRTRTY